MIEDPRRELKYQLYTLDWIGILKAAIESRPTSWGDDPVREWRNASDEVCFALARALEAKGLLSSIKDDLADFVLKHPTTVRMYENGKRVL
jgi:hypothetical protein